MKFSNDSQRKAVFANMNKFAAISETGESLRPVFVSMYHDPKEQCLQNQLVGEDNDVKGYTSAEFGIYPTLVCSEDGEPIRSVGGEVSHTVEPWIIDADGSCAPTKDTIILAGEDYKRYEGGKDPSKRKLRRIILVGDKLLKTDEHNKEAVSGLAKIDRERGRPVYSRESDMELAKKILVNIHTAYKPTEDSDITLALDALDNNDVSTAKTIIDTMIQSEKLYQNEDDFGMYKASAALNRVIGDGK